MEMAGTHYSLPTPRFGRTERISGLARVVRANAIRYLGEEPMLTDTFS